MFNPDSRFRNFLNKDSPKIEGIYPDMSNSELWEDYCDKARRFSAEKWNNLLGISSKNIPELMDAGEWTTRDYLVIGEFIRWYHHRFAFEIAMYDFMGVEVLPDSLSERSKNLIGLIAYSHGIGIRDIEIEEYCNVYFGNRDYIDDCPLYYLIALLRLADYLDADIERAPKSLSDIHIFLSETSRREWILNQNFRFDSYGWRDAMMTRSLDLPATPQFTTEFVDVERRILGLQREFDSSIAVLEEIYHSKYFLTVSRVTSNILKSKSRKGFARKFFINDTRIRTSPDILPLLVGPLYVNNPAYGVRELLQNAVDACKQREENEQGYRGKINISIDTCKKLFLIEDNGIGMNENIVSNYYLNAGSSYRNSEEWEEEFLDDFGKAKVLRIGHFGIGALATFLIGDKVTVTTRYKGNSLGCEFAYTLNVGKSIDVFCKKNIETGTSIKIEMSEKACHYFGNRENQNQWSKWYRYENPEIKIILDGKELVNDRILPSTFEDRDGWFRYNSKLFSNFIWSYEGSILKSGDCRYFNRELICNGIPIEEMESPYHVHKDQWTNTHWSIIRGYGFDIHLPLISLDDYDGQINMDLSRRILEKLPLEQTFIEEVYKYLIAELLSGKCFSSKHSLWECRYGYIPMAHSAKGYIILARSFILHIGKPTRCLISSKQHIDTEIPIGSMYKFDNIGIMDSIHYNVGSYLGDKVFLNGDLLMDNRRTFTKCIGGVICKKSDAPYYVNKLELSELFGKKYEGIYLLNPNEKKFTKKDVDTILTLASNLEPDDIMFLEYIPSAVKEGENNLMLKMLQKYIPVDRNGGWIPYEIEERRYLYPEAFEELSGYMCSFDHLG